VEVRRLVGRGLIVAGVVAGLIAATVLVLAGPIGRDGSQPGAETGPRRPATARDDPTSPLLPASSGALVDETPEQFFITFARALRERDTGFLVSRLHGFVLERYTTSSCRASLAGRPVPEYDVEVLEVRTSPFVYDTDDLRRTVPGALAVRIGFARDGLSLGQTEAHVVLDGDTYRWFTDCGTPKAGAV
jgi:hypothetical protein